jgi:hypothetical protein
MLVELIMRYLLILSISCCFFVAVGDGSWWVLLGYYSAILNVNIFLDYEIFMMMQLNAYYCSISNSF